jgi:hypothetical protein
LTIDLSAFDRDDRLRSSADSFEDDHHLKSSGSFGSKVLFYFIASTYGLLLAPSLCKVPNQINTPDINFVAVRKNFVVENKGLSAEVRTTPNAHRRLIYLYLTGMTACARL